LVQIPRARGSQSVIRTTPTLARKGRTGKSKTAGIIGETIVNVAEMLEKVRVNEETSRANNNFMRSMLDVEREANENTDVSPEKQQEFKQRITDARVESARFIKQPLARETFTARAKGKQNILNSKVQGIFGKKIIDQDRANVQENLDLLKESFITASNSKQRTSLMKEASTLLDSRAQAGTISFELASIRKLQIKDEWAIEDVESDIIANADVSLEELNKGKKGLYPTLKTTDRQALVTKAEKQVKDNENRAKTLKVELQDKQNVKWHGTDGQAIQQFLAGDLSGKNAEDLARGLDISPEMAKGMIGVSTSPKAGRKRDDAEYERLRKNFYTLDDSDPKAVRKWRSEVWAADINNKLKRNDTKELMSLSMNPLDSSPAQKAKKNVIFQALKTMSLAMATPTILVNQDIINMVQDVFFREIKDTPQKQADIDKAVDVAIAEGQKSINPLREKYKLNEEYSENGISFVVRGYKDDGTPMIRRLK